MSKKRPQLGSALRTVDSKPATQRAPEPNPEGQGRVVGRAPSRVGRKMVGGYFDPEVSKQLRAIAADEDTTTQALVGEALNLLFRDRSKPPIA